MGEGSWSGLTIGLPVDLRLGGWDFLAGFESSAAGKDERLDIGGGCDIPV